ncbi:type IV secretion system ATPase VirD4 [Rhizobium leguminosarum]|uniref:Transmembrane conjugative DNA transfer protein n=4 Tax=Rhizobium TaxID=379 RepID=Q1M9V4_RHIJ3|nr:type IV secretion system ATPase VirD4 [Rhizobium johnstonii]NEJ81852.1 type IV secretion system ATPase VirD4 [Rhizobium leguminosarum]CAK11600.1 putative transmembrane conjugative DNA transfer protein [Rhizobium johnstonii 3841]
MDGSTTRKLNTLLFAFLFSLTMGLLFASIYASFCRHGISRETINRFDIFSFWYETPLYVGYATPVFLRGLTIAVSTAVITTMVGAIVILKKRNYHGTARWATRQELQRAGYIRRFRNITGPIFGKTVGPRWPGRYLTNGEQPHSLVVAPTRAGKGVGVVIPTLLTFNGSILALDVKGELFELTSRARMARGDRVFKFAPLDSAGRTHSYNPVLDIVNMPPERRFSETRRLAVNLIVAKGKGSEGFIEGARDLFIAGILACIERGTPTIGAVYDLFTQPGEKYKLFAQLAEETQNQEAQRIFDNMAGNDTKILTSYTSVLGDGGLNLWADPLIKAATTKSDFSIYDLRRDPTSIFLCVSPNDLEVIAPLIRLFFQQVVSILQRTLPKKDEIFEVLFLLDEFKHLGKLEAIETAVTTIAGYKGRFMFIIQSLSALTGAYEESGKENFLSNTGIQIFMATADDETPNYISKAIGDYTFRARSTSFSQRNIFDTNIQLSDQGAPLLRSEQVRLIDDDMEIVLIKGQPPLRLKKVKYYSDRVLKRIFDNQSGALPEPEPLHLATTYVQAPATLLVAAESLPDEAKSEDALQAALPDFAEVPVKDHAFSDFPAGGAASSDAGGKYADVEYAHDVYGPDRVSDDHLSEEELQALAAQRALLDRIIDLQRRSNAWQTGELAPGAMHSDDHGS